MLDAKRLKRLGRQIAASLFCLATFAGSYAAYAQDLYGPLAKNPRTGGTLTMGSLLEPPGLDPFHQGADARIRVTVLMYQGLFYEHPNGDAKPLLAESYQVSPN